MVGSTALLAEDGIYDLKTGVKESELEGALVEHAEAVFGDRAFYFPIKQKVESATKQRATDGLLLDLSSADSPRFWLVEVELSTHDMMKDVGPQIKNFLSALKNEETLRKVLNTLYQEVQKRESVGNRVRKLVGKDVDLHHYLDQLLHDEKARGVIIVIDEFADELEELRTDWFTGQTVEIVLFRIYERGGKRICYFTPYGGSPIGEVKRKYPETHTSWKALYDSVPDNVKELVDNLTQQVVKRFGNVEHGPALTRSWYRFLAKGIEGRKKATFLVIFLTRSHLHLRIGVRTGRFDDPQHITKTYKGFFWARLPDTQEVGFNVSSDGELEYALGLVKQSYDRAKD